MESHVRKRAPAPRRRPVCASPRSCADGARPVDGTEQPGLRSEAARCGHGRGRCGSGDGHALLLLLRPGVPAQCHVDRPERSVGHLPGRPLRRLGVPRRDLQPGDRHGDISGDRRVARPGRHADRPLAHEFHPSGSSWFPTRPRRSCSCRPCCVLASTVVVAADALAWTSSGYVRPVVPSLCIAGRGRWPVAAAIIWGHPEDALVMTFGCCAMVAVLRGNWRRAGWLFGVAIACPAADRPDHPALLGRPPRGGQSALRRPLLASSRPFWSGSLSSATRSGTYRALMVQPTPPYFNHATPWVSLAPHVVLSPVTAPTAGTGALRHSAAGALR